MLADTGSKPASERRYNEYSKSRVTRETVLRAAVQEFAENGFAGARVDRIAELANMNKTAIYYHFGDKYDLFSAALEFGYEQFGFTERAWRTGGGTTLEQMERLIGVMFDACYGNRLHATLISDGNRHNGRHVSATLRARITELIAPAIADVKALLERGRREGLFNGDADPVHVHLSIISLSMFFLSNRTTLSAGLRYDVGAAEEVSRWRRHVVDFVMNAIRA